MFTVFKKILNGSDITDTDLEKINDFIFCRWLSGNPTTLVLSNVINYYHKLPLKIKVKFIQEIVKNKIKYIPYPKSEKIKLKNVENICKYFNISEQKANLYLEFLTKDDLDYLEKLYRQ